MGKLAGDVGSLHQEVRPLLENGPRILLHTAGGGAHHPHHHPEGDAALPLPHPRGEDVLLLHRGAGSLPLKDGTHHQFKDDTLLLHLLKGELLHH